MPNSESNRRDLRKRRTSNRHIKAAYNRLSESWFPVNPDLLESISEKLSVDTPGNSNLQFSELLEKDASIFLCCVHNLRNTLHDNSEESSIDPALLNNLSKENLKELIPQNPQLISNHRFEDINEAQASQFQFAITSATTTKALAEKTDIDPAQAYAASLFRNLGMTLVAWNYPHVFQRCVSNQNSQENLNEALSRVIGFSPAMLGLYVAERWGLLPEVRIAAGDSLEDEIEISAETSSRAQQMLKLCEIGDCFARMNNPQLYPERDPNWDSAKAELETILGPGAISLLRKRIAENLEAYVKFRPDIFAAVTTAAHPDEDPGTRGQELMRNNRYIKNCPLILQSSFARLYAQINGHSVSKSAVDYLVSDIIPNAGFTVGCVYLLEPDSMSLVARLPIGNVDLSRFTAVRIGEQSIDFDPVAAAFKCKTPIMEEGIMIDGHRVSYVAGVLGNDQKAGVLYLEIAEKTVEDSKAEPVLYYKAIRQALGDCLGLQ